MKPGSELGNIFEIDEAAQEALREHQIYQTLLKVDGAFDTFPRPQANNLVAARLASGAYNTDELRDLTASGEVQDIRVSPPYDPYEPDEMPGSVIVSRCQRVEVRPRSSFPRRKTALSRPVCTYYVFGIQPDLVDFHSTEQTPNGADSDTPPIVTLEIDEERFARSPSSTGFKFGIIRREDEIACFKIEENPTCGEIIAVAAMGGGYSIGDDRPSIGPIDRAQQKMTRVPFSPDLCGTLTAELERIAALQRNPEKNRRRLIPSLGSKALDRKT